MSVLGKLEISDSTFHWQIQNFSSIIDDAAVGVQILSPVFDMRCPRSQKLQWQLLIYPGGYDEDKKEYVGLFLLYQGEHEVSVTYSFSILDDKHNEVAVFSTGKELSCQKNRASGTSRYCLKTTIRNETNRALTKDTLLISCTITVRSMGLDDAVHYDAEDSARAHFERLLESGDLSDVTFKIGNQQMQLHKATVASLSPVFLAMFQHQMREKKENVVQIPDVKYEVMKELFRYIYVRKVNGIENIASDLLVAADKYDVQGLKILCEDFLSRDINADSALQLLELALKYNTTFLKSKATEFVVSRLDEFVDRPEFKRMNGCCKDELLCAIARNKVKDNT